MTTAAVLTAVTAVVGLLMYLLQRRDSPAALLEKAEKEYTDEVNKGNAILKELLDQENLPRDQRDPVRLLNLTESLRAQRLRIAAARARRDRLRP